MDAEKIGKLREAIRFQLGQQVAYDENAFCWFIKNQEKINHLQADVAKHRWIPVSERLPEESGEYQVVRKANSRPTTRQYWDGDKTWSSMDIVTHWKPIILPNKDK